MDTGFFIGLRKKDFKDIGLMVSNMVKGYFGKIIFQIKEFGQMEK